jgi:hypothetical protein
VSDQDNGTSPPRKKWRGIFLMIFIFLVAPVLLLMLVWKDRCVHTVMNTVPSSSGDLQAILQQTDCGLAMSKATQVKLEERRGSSWKSVGDVIVLHGVHQVTLEWQDSDLQVGVPEGAVIVKSRDQVGDTRVTYVPPK